MCKVNPDPRVIVGHAEAFKISPALYYYNDVDVKAFSVAKGQYDFTVEDLYQSNTPNKITVGSAYLTLFKGMEKEGLFKGMEKGLYLERNEYPNGYCLYVFNINEEDDDANLITHPKNTT